MHASAKYASSRKIARENVVPRSRKWTATIFNKLNTHITLIKKNNNNNKKRTWCCVGISLNHWLPVHFSTGRCCCFYDFLQQTFDNCFVTVTWTKSGYIMLNVTLLIISLMTDFKKNFHHAKLRVIIYFVLWTDNLSTLRPPISQNPAQISMSLYYLHFWKLTESVCKQKGFFISFPFCLY